MGWRRCDECDRWLSTAEYDVGADGDTICPVHLTYVSGFKDDYAPEMAGVNDNRGVYSAAKDELRDAYGSDDSNGGGGWREAVSQLSDDVRDEIADKGVHEVDLPDVDLSDDEDGDDSTDELQPDEDAVQGDVVSTSTNTSLYSDEVTARDKVHAAVHETATKYRRMTVDKVRRSMTLELDVDRDEVPSDETIRRVLRSLDELGVLSHRDNSPYYRLSERYRD